MFIKLILAVSTVDHIYIVMKSTGKIFTGSEAFKIFSPAEVINMSVLLEIQLHYRAGICVKYRPDDCHAIIVVFDAP